MSNRMGQISEDFKLPIVQRDAILKEMKELLTEYGYQYETDALLKIIDTWAIQKGWIINLLSKNENWNAEKFQIQFSCDYERDVDLSMLYEFTAWAKDRVRKSIPDYKYAGMNRTEASNSYNRVKTIYNFMSQIALERADGYGDNVVTVNGMSHNDVKAEVKRLARIFNIMVDNSIEIAYEKYVSNEDADRYNRFDLFCTIIYKYFENARKENETGNIHLCPRELMDKINHLFPDLAKERQKISKIIQKVCIMYGLDKVKDLREVTHNGITQMKDFGWNLKKAELGDAINPLKFSRHTIISVNPIDYLTMSFGYNWASCHTIDIHGYRTCHNFSGEYSSGTISYMLDNSSMIFYTVDPAYTGTEFELQDKMQRCVFAIGEDKLYEGRVYPDGRDNGDKGYAVQFRNLMQKIIADALGATNLWVVKKGTSECHAAMHGNGGLAYPDWLHYDDCNMSYLKDDDELNMERFTINARPLSIVNGETHDNCENIEGDEAGFATCDHCGHAIHHEDDYVCTYDGNYYCDYECAEEAGYRWCEDVEEWRDDYYLDEYTQTYFTDTSEMVTIYDSRGTIYYSCPEHAEADGYIYCDNVNRYVMEDDTDTDSYTGERFAWTDDCVETQDEHYYSCPENAEADGYIEVDGEWVKREEETA